MDTGIHTLQARVADASVIHPVYRKDLQPGDWLRITTKNSVYTLCALEGDLYAVTGGWFDRKGLSPTTTTIAGCTWGGSVLKHDIVAAPGLCLEFGNQVVTTRIQDVRVFRARSREPLN